MAKKIYAVRNGRVPGIYTSWEDCQKQVSGFSGAVFKGFATQDEAITFLNSEEKSNLSEYEATAYCDGSFNIEDGRFSYGAVIFWNDKKYTFSESFFDGELSKMRNVAGEIKGAEKVFSFCLENGIKSVELFYDYEGIEKWCTGKWKRNKEGTILFHNNFVEISKLLNVKFTKVKGHSGDKYNDEADSLAKEALGIK